MSSDQLKVDEKLSDLKYRKVFEHVLNATSFVSPELLISGHCLQAVDSVIKKLTESFQADDIVVDMRAIYANPRRSKENFHALLEIRVQGYHHESLLIFDISTG